MPRVNTIASEPAAIMVRRILVTGANKGIGLAIVNRCMQDHSDTHVVMGCRSASRGDAAKAELVRSNPEWSDRLTVLQMDTGEDESVKAAARHLTGMVGEKPPPLYAIVNNAGIASSNVAETLNVNVRGPKRVDDAFLPLLDPSCGRIVQMSSGAASGCVSRSSAEKQALFTDQTITWARISSLMEEASAYTNGAADFEANGIGTPMSAGAYGLSKALLNSYTICAAREHPKLKINSCSPGMIATDFIGNMLPWWVPVPNMLLRYLVKKMMNGERTFNPNPAVTAVFTPHTLRACRP